MDGSTTRHKKRPTLMGATWMKVFIPLENKIPIQDHVDGHL